MNKEERLVKVRRIILLETELWFLKCHRPERRDVGGDWGCVRAEDEVELTRLYLELYPEPLKDLMEDVKIRQEKMKAMKTTGGNRIPPLTFKQKIGLLFRRRNEKARR